MADPINYVKEAFKRQENIIALGGFAVAGVVFSAGFIFLGAALELGYLWALAGNARFQRLVRSEKNQALTLSTLQEREQLLRTLPASERSRYQALSAVRQQVYDTWQSRDAVTQSILQPSVDKLDYLLDTFLRAQLTLFGISNHLTLSRKDQIQKDIQALENDMKLTPSAKLKDVKTKNLEILKQRLARLNKLQEDMDVIRTQINTLENAVKFIADQSVSLSDPQQISDQVDRVVSDVQDAEKSIADVEIFLNAQKEINDKSAMAAKGRMEQQGG